MAEKRKKRKKVKKKREKKEEKKGKNERGVVCHKGQSFAMVSLYLNELHRELWKYKEYCFRTKNCGSEREVVHQHVFYSISFEKGIDSNISSVCMQTTEKDLVLPNDTYTPVEARHWK